MSATRVTREQLVEQSVQDFLRDQLLNGRHYPASQIEFMDAFVEDQVQGELTKSYIALGFNFDDGGTQAEIGSDLLTRVHMIEVWVIGQDPLRGRNLASAVQEIMDEQDPNRLPLVNVEDPARPVIDYLLIDQVQNARQPVSNPKPWARALWIVTMQLRDEYHARWRG